MDQIKIRSQNLALEAEKPDIVEFLLAQGANANISPRGGRSPLDVAIDKKNLDFVKLLVKHVSTLMQLTVVAKQLFFWLSLTLK